MKHIQAIETTYNGYRFRSRLEARWAVFYYRTLHNSKRQAKRVCYCQGCAMMLGHGAPVRKESIPDA